MLYNKTLNDCSLGKHVLFPFKSHIKSHNEILRKQNKTDVSLVSSQGYIIENSKGKPSKVSIHPPSRSPSISLPIFLSNWLTLYKSFLFSCSSFSRLLSSSSYLCSSIELSTGATGATPVGSNNISSIYKCICLPSCLWKVISSIYKYIYLSSCLWEVVSSIYKCLHACEK